MTLKWRLKSRWQVWTKTKMEKSVSKSSMNIALRNQVVKKMMTVKLKVKPWPSTQTTLAGLVELRPEKK
jgi:hypothetical protein